jgi:excinuclease ABC subunit C
VLDEVRGIGPRRKSTLIQAFGSVARIEHASAEEIAERGHVPRELAERILTHLRKD